MCRLFIYNLLSGFNWTEWGGGSLIWARLLFVAGMAWSDTLCDSDFLPFAINSSHISGAGQVVLICFELTNRHIWSDEHVCNRRYDAESHCVGSVLKMKNNVCDEAKGKRGWLAVIFVDFGACSNIKKECAREAIRNAGIWGCQNWANREWQQFNGRYEIALFLARE